MEKFKEVYQALYNSSGSRDEMKSVEDKVSDLLKTQNNITEVNKLSADVVKESVCMMKTKKMDVSGGFSSDCFLHAPDALFSLLSVVFRCWLFHGKITQSILVCAFVPLLKSSLKDPTSSESYRAIAGSSLVLQIFERCILRLWGDCLQSDSLQFGFKKGCGTNTATWLVQEVLQHYLHKGSKPIAVVLDCTKAFDLARFDCLFGRLIEKVPAVVVRVLYFSYKEQLAWVKWGRSNVSSSFSISNGTRQGSVASPTFWAIYLDTLFVDLRLRGVGCHVGGVFMGVVGYADDLLLLAPNRQAAQLMLKTCEEYASKYNIRFSTHEEPKKSKSKCLYVVGPRSSGVPAPAPLMLCGKPLPWVDRCDHLGHIITTDGTSVKDCQEKRATFIDNSVKTREMFRFAHPIEKITAVTKHCSDFYGSC